MLPSASGPACLGMAFPPFLMKLLYRCDSVVISSFVRTGYTTRRYWDAIPQLAEGIWQTFEETSGYVRPERVNKWPNSMTDIWWWRWWWWTTNPLQISSVKVYSILSLSLCNSLSLYGSEGKKEINTLNLTTNFRRSAGPWGSHKMNRLAAWLRPLVRRQSSLWIQFWDILWLHIQHSAYILWNTYIIVTTFTTIRAVPCSNSSFAPSHTVLSG